MQGEAESYHRAGVWHLGRFWDQGLDFGGLGFRFRPYSYSRNDAQSHEHLWNIKSDLWVIYRLHVDEGVEFGCSESRLRLISCQVRCPLARTR